MIYDILQRKIIGTIGSPNIFQNLRETLVSPDGKWLVNGYNNKSGANFYSIMNLKTGAWVKTPSFVTGDYKKDLRIDPAPRWNRNNNQILVSGLDNNKIRQLFVISIDYKSP